MIVARMRPSRYRHASTSMELPESVHKQQVEAEVGFELRREVTVGCLETRQGITEGTHSPLNFVRAGTMSLTAGLSRAALTRKSSRTSWARSC